MEVIGDACQPRSSEVMVGVSRGLIFNVHALLVMAFVQIMTAVCVHVYSKSIRSFEYTAALACDFVATHF